MNRSGREEGERKRGFRGPNLPAQRLRGPGLMGQAGRIAWSDVTFLEKV
jgi:hypothetical protein